MTDINPGGAWRWPGSLLLLLACATALAFVASGFGARFGLWDFRVGFQILRWVPWVGGVVAALALIALFVPRLRAGRSATLAGALIIAFLAAAVPLFWFQQARKVPPINDITTDMTDPPAFSAVVPLRANAPVPATYAGEATAKQQAAGYPDIKPAIVAMELRAAFDAALANARAMGWEIVATDPAAGRIEATATTPWFGFKDDVVIRVAQVEKGSRIDVRSVSRVGKGDLGANARRVREYLAKLPG